MPLQVGELPSYLSRGGAPRLSSGEFYHRRGGKKKGDTLAYLDTIQPRVKRVLRKETSRADRKGRPSSAYGGAHRRVNSRYAMKINERERDTTMPSTGARPGNPASPSVPGRGKGERKAAPASALLQLDPW